MFTDTYVLYLLVFTTTFGRFYLQGRDEEREAWRGRRQIVRGSTESHIQTFELYICCSTLHHLATWMKKAEGGGGQRGRGRGFRGSCVVSDLSGNLY